MLNKQSVTFITLFLSYLSSRCASLDRKHHRNKRSQASYPIRATSTKSIPEKVVPFVAALPAPLNSRCVSHGERACSGSLSSSYPYHHTQLEESKRSQEAELRLDRIMSDASTSQALPLSPSQHSFHDYRLPPPPPLDEEAQQILLNKLVIHGELLSRIGSNY